MTSSRGHFSFFFFQAEDGIRDVAVTGVQTCALPISAEAVQRGVFEIEYGLEAAQGHQNINGLLKFGLFKNLELRFANNPIERNSGIAGTGDSAAGFKWRFVSQRKQVPTLSLLYTATLPTAANNLGAGDFGQSVQLLVSKDFGKHHFDFNEGVQLRRRPGVGGFDRNYFTSLSWSHPLGEKQRWGLTAEIAGFSKTNEIGRASCRERV